MVMCVAEPASVYRDASEELSAFAGFGPVISTAGIIVFSFIVQVSHVAPADETRLDATRQLTTQACPTVFCLFNRLQFRLLI